MRLHLSRARSIALSLGLLILAGRPAIANPAEVANLQFSGSQSMTWTTLAGAAGYHVYRGTAAGLRTGDFGACLIGSVQGPTVSVTETPPLGTAYVYLASGYDASGEGTLGQTSVGVPRSPSPRCLPARRFMDLTTQGAASDGVEDGAAARRNPSVAEWNSARERTGVHLHTGEFVLDAIDLRLGGRGNRNPQAPGAHGWEFSRHYRSQVSYDGPLGPGWDFEYNARLRAAGSDVRFHDGHGHSELFVRVSATRFTSPRGVYAVLIQNPGGGFTLREPDGVLRDFHAFDGSNRQGSLEAVSDGNGNRITLAYDIQGLLTGIVDALGRNVGLGYDADGRLATVSDATGRTVLYTFDAAHHLVSVRSPVVLGTPNGNDFPLGKRTTYVYDSGAADPRLTHNLLAVIAPNDLGGGTPFLQNVYGNTPGAFSFDRVVQQVIGGVNASGVPAGGTQSFAYTSLNPNSDPALPNLPRRQVVWTDRNGNERVLVHNAVGNALSSLDRTNRGLRPAEGDYLTSTTFNVDGERTERQFPQGNGESLVYDTGAPDRSRHGNLLQSTRHADPAGLGGRGDGRGGELTDAVTTYTYDPVYNQVASITDPRGNDPGFVPPNGGGASPDRYRKSWTFDYQEGDPALTGLSAYAARFGVSLTGIQFFMGDVNGDGQVAQIAGNPVLIQEPPVTLDPGSRQATIEGDTTQEARTLLRYNGHGQVVAVIDAEGNRNDYDYYPETDPDGDGVAAPPPADGRVLDAVAGGYLRTRIMDTVAAAGRDNGTDPAPVAARNDFLWNAWGDLTDWIDGRGVRTRWIVTVLGQSVEIRRAAATADAAGPLGDPMTGRGEPGLVPYGYRIRQYYDANDNLVRHETEDAGATRGVGPFVETTWTHDILDDVVESTHEVTAGASTLTQLRYDANQNLIRWVKPEGNAFEWAYDERNLVLSHTRGASGPRGGAPSTRLFEYDGNRSGTSVVDGRGGVHEFVQDGFDRLARTVDPVGGTDDIYRDPTGQVTRVLRRGTVGGPTPPDRSGSVNVDLADTLYGRDERGRLFRIDRGLFMPQGSSLARSASLIEGPLAPGDGWITTLLEHDRASRRTFLVKDSAAVLRWDFDGLGRPLRLTDPSLSTWEWTYDANYNGVELVQTEIPTGPPALLPATFATTAFYDALDRITTLVDPMGLTQRWQYDSLDAIVAASDANGPLLATIARRSPGLAGTTVQANTHGNVVRAAYDGLSREVLTERVLTASRLGNGTWSPPPNTSNPANLDGLVRVYTVWDGNSLVTSRQDDAGNVTTQFHDNLDRLVSTVADDGTVESTTYDGEDLRVGRVDANGTVVTAAFDPARRLVSRDVTPGPGVEGTTQQSFQHDGLDRVTFASDNNGPGSGDDVYDVLAYDSLGRVVEEGQGSAIGLFHTDTGWLAEDLLQQIVYPSGRVVYHSHDAAERLYSVQDAWTGLSATFEYYGLDRVHTRRLGNGARSTLLDIGETTGSGFDGTRRPTLLWHLAPGNVLLAAFQNRFDRVGNLTGVRRFHHPGAFQTLNGELYTYDSQSRLVGFQNAFFTSSFVPSGSPAETLSQTLDGAGNAVATLHNGLDRRNTPNNLNEYDELQSGGTRVDDGVPDDFRDLASTPQPDGLNLGHDKSGNEIDTGLFLVAFDFLDRPVRATRKADGLPVAAYAHDALGRRVLRSVVNSGALDESRLYLYGGYPQAGLIEERDGFGSETRAIVLGDGRGEQLFQWSSVSGSAYLLQDVMGSHIAVLSSSSPTVLERTIYDAFGRPQFQTASNSALLDGLGNFLPRSQYGVADLFLGMRYDPELGQRTNQVTTDVGGVYLDGSHALSSLTGRSLSRGMARTWDGLSSAGNSYAISRPQFNVIGAFDLIHAPTTNALASVESFHSFLIDTNLAVINASFVQEDGLEKKFKDLSEKFEKAAEELKKKQEEKDAPELQETLEGILEQLKKINDFIERIKKAKEAGEKAKDDPVQLLKGVNDFLKEAMDKLKNAPGPVKIIGTVIGVYIQALDSTIGLLDCIPMDYVRWALDMYKRWCKGDADPVKCALDLTDPRFGNATDEDRERARKRIEAQVLKDNPPAPAK